MLLDANGNQADKPAMSGFKINGSVSSPKTGESKGLSKQAINMAGGANVTQTSAFWYSPELTNESWLLPKCLTADNYILMQDGSCASIGDLYADGSKDIPVVSFDVVGSRCSPAVALRVEKTGEQKKIVRVVLDGGGYMRCTPKHKILM